MKEYKKNYKSSLGSVTDLYYGIRDIDEPTLDSIITEENEKNNLILSNFKLSEIVNELNKISATSRDLDWPTKEGNGLLIFEKKDKDKFGRVFFYNGNDKRECYLQLEMGVRDGAVSKLIDFDELYQDQECVIGDYRYVDKNFIYSVDEKNEEIYKLIVIDPNGDEVIITDKSDGEIEIYGSDLFYIEKEGYEGKYVVKYNLKSREKEIVYTLINPERTLGIDIFNDSNIICISEIGHNSKEERVFRLDSKGNIIEKLSVSSDERDEYLFKGFENITLINHEDDRGFSSISKINLEDGLASKEVIISINHKIENFIYDEKYIYLNVRNGAGLTIEIYNYQGERLKVISGEGKSFTLECILANGNLEYLESSWLSCDKIYELDLENNRELLTYSFYQEGKVAYGEYQRFEATSRDGVAIEISMIKSHKETKNSVVYFYGAYGESIDPFWSPERDILLKQGINYTILHVRGGGEKGREWHKSGSKLLKNNTFNDAFDCINYLREIDVLDKVVLEGDSAGAGSVATLLNMDRNIASGALLAVPFLDVFSTMNDETLPLTLGEYCEWGNPNEIENASYIYNWSPIDNIKTDVYPPILVVVGTNDVRVGFWEGLKYGYKLRDKNEGNQVSLHIIKDGGHNGSSKRDEKFKNKAIELLWLIERVNN